MYRRISLTALVLLFAASPMVAQENGPDLPPGFDEQMPLHHDGRGLGPFSRSITTSSTEAQLYFDQGIQLLYAFDPNLAARSFREGWKKDPNCAMCYLGEAWAWGPYLNGPMVASDAPLAYAAVQKAHELAEGNTSPLEHALINAMAERYEDEHDRDRRRELDEQWAEKINELYAENPRDLDLGFLAGEALMLLEPRREWWEISNPAIQEIHRVLETVLQQDITHPGACHLYVHATERTDVPGKAEACAEHLGSSIPGASHIQHMPSHTFNRIGRWGDAVRGNTEAWHSDLKAEYGDGFAIYPSHNLHMLLFAASNDGQGAAAIQAAKHYAAMMDGGSYYQALTLFRFGYFEEILELDNTPEGTTPRGLWDFSKGYASLRTGDEGTARWYLNRVKQGAEDGTDMVRGHSAASILGIVSSILEGEILRANGNVQKAVEILEKGVELEDGLVFDEPEPLNFSVRHWLGDALLEAGEGARAAEVYRAELKDHPHNGWSLFGLERALRAQGKDQEADQVHAEFEVSWARADVYIRSSIF